MTISEHNQKTAFAADIVAHESVEDVFVLTQAQQFQAKNGPFWRLTLQDASGQIEGKVWSPLAQEFSEFSINSFYAIAGRSNVYKDKVELSIAAISPLDQEAVNNLSLGDFIAVSPYSPEKMLNELKGLCERHVVHPPLVRFFDLLFSDDAFVAQFKKAPAAKAMHHAYAGGLLEHTLSICRLCMSIADNYPAIDRQILLAGAVCHDLGKIWELRSGVSIDYTDEGRLVGHISLGLERITPYMQRAGLEPEHIMHIQHLILSHHGTYEFGSARLPSTAEAFVLHFADNIDAKLQQVSQALGEDSGGAQWSGFVRGLDRQVYKSPSLPTSPASTMPQTLAREVCGHAESADYNEAPFPHRAPVSGGGRGEDVSPWSGEPQAVAGDYGDGSMVEDGALADFPEQDSGYLDALAHGAEQFQPIDEEGEAGVLWAATLSPEPSDATGRNTVANEEKESIDDVVQPDTGLAGHDALSEKAHEGEHKNAVLADKEKPASPLKQSPLPLLEQCSLLLKE